jgi:putative hemolysin
MVAWLRLGHVFVLVAQTSISTLIILIFAEFLPKVLFRIDPSRSLGFFAIPLQILYIVLWLPMMVMTGISELILRLFGVAQQTRPSGLRADRPDDFLKDVGNGQTNATTMDAEVEYFRNTLELSNTKVRELMVPRAEIEAMEVDDPVEDLRQRFIDSGMSKLLIHKDNLDNIIGLCSRLRTVPESTYHPGGHASGELHTGHHACG